MSEILGVPMDKIRVKPADNFVGNNAMCTGGSIGSEVCAYVWTLLQSILSFLESFDCCVKICFYVFHILGSDESVRNSEGALEAVCGSCKGIMGGYGRRST